MMLRWRPTDGAHATSRTQSWWASNFCSSTHPPFSSLHSDHTNNYTCIFTYLLHNCTLQKSLRLCCFKSDHEIWQDCSSSEFASIDGFRFRTWRHTFKTAAVTSSPSSLRFCCFKTDRDEIWQECSSRKYASTDELDFWFDTIISKWWPCCPFTHKSVATWWVNMKRYARMTIFSSEWMNEYRTFI